MTLQEHAQAIGDAIRAAHNDGFELDNGDGSPIPGMDLNSVVAGTIHDWATVELPAPTYY
ncbi:hypothetical protein ACGFZC_16320 [[Kitasatospora] papulosa]|uniref:hypothetical protein n=1 Tax=[Kitasatospora] papulosa TaxID=1464011 RepID=UPI003717B361